MGVQDAARCRQSPWFAAGTERLVYGVADAERTLPNGLDRWVAVGTTIADRPPHGPEQCARLKHLALIQQASQQFQNVLKLSF
jgi:hypothetical protein